MKTVSNEEFIAAISDSDNAAIMQTVINQFRRIVRDDSLLEQLANIGMFKALGKYDGVSCKFTTYLFKHIRWEILTHLKTKKFNTVSLEDIGDIPRNHTYMEEVLDSLSDYEKDIVHKREIDNCTLSEIAQTYNSCPETVRRHLIKAYNKILTDNID